MSALNLESYLTHRLILPCYLLEVLNLGYNEYNGTIPNIYGKLPKLYEIDLSENNFEGIFPANIFDAVKIEKMNLSGNKWQGDVALLSGLKKTMILKELRLGSSFFFGELSIDLVETMPKLRVLDLSNNTNCEEKMFQFKDCIETEWDTYCCNKSGSSEEEFCGEVSNEDDYYYEGYILKPTGLWGTLPPEYVKFSYMEELNLSANSLEGTHPPEYVKFTYMEDLDLSGNSFRGNIPLEFVRFTYTRELDLLGNSLSGTILLEFVKIAKQNVHIKLEGNDG